MRKGKVPFVCLLSFSEPQKSKKERACDRERETCGR